MDTEPKFNSEDPNVTLTIRLIMQGKVSGVILIRLLGDLVCSLFTYQIPRLSIFEMIKFDLWKPSQTEPKYEYIVEQT